VLTGGFSEVNRAQRVAIAQNEFREAMKDWPPERLETYIAKLYPAYWLKVDLPHKIEHAKFVRASEDAEKRLATTVAFDAERAVTELTLLAPDHPWLLSIIAGACAMAGANIVDAQIYTTTDGRALDTISLSREFDRDEDEERPRQPHRRFNREGAARRIAAARCGGETRTAERPHSAPSPWSRP
jgi:[protein-PII] uridylyltransferase